MIDKCKTEKFVDSREPTRTLFLVRSKRRTRSNSISLVKYVDFSNARISSSTWYSVNLVRRRASLGSTLVSVGLVVLTMEQITNKIKKNPACPAGYTAPDVLDYSLLLRRTRQTSGPIDTLIFALVMHRSSTHWTITLCKPSLLAQRERKHYGCMRRAQSLKRKHGGLVSTTVTEYPVYIQEKKATAIILNSKHRVPCAKCNRRKLEIQDREMIKRRNLHLHTWRSDGWLAVASETRVGDLDWRLGSGMWRKVVGGERLN